MNGLLPFEYGALYKIIANVLNHQDLLNGFMFEDRSYLGYSYNAYGINGTINYGQIDLTKSFLPLAFIESQQKVILEVSIMETEKTSGHLIMSGMSFQQSNLEKNSYKPIKVSIDVNLFIKNFEKIL